MARTKHPKRTPFYGVLLILLAMAAFGAATSVDEIVLRVVLCVVAVAAAGVGFVVTFRDYSF